MTLSERFEQFSGDYLTFEKVTRKLNLRADLHAFLLLDKLIPGDQNMVVSPNHDEIYLNVDAEELEKVVTDEQIQELVRCGVFYEDETDSLCMFA